MLSWKVGVLSYFLLNSIPLCRCTTVFFPFYYCCAITIIPISPSHYSPLHYLLPPPTFNFPLPCCLCPWAFIHVPWWPFPSFAQLFLSPLPSGYCQFLLYFHVSGYILLAGLFCWLSSTQMWNHTVFVYHCLAYFTSIMLSRSSHAVSKGQNSFLSAA